VLIVFSTIKAEGKANIEPVTNRMMSRKFASRIAT